MGYNLSSDSKPRKEMAIDILKKHPNYKEELPREGDTLLSYTLRYLGNLISPPQYPNESYNIECTTIKQGISESYLIISLHWRDYCKQQLAKEIGNE
jgi:hypothetical protein